MTLVERQRWLMVGFLLVAAGCAHPRVSEGPLASPTERTETADRDPAAPVSVAVTPLESPTAVVAPATLAFAREDWTFAEHPGQLISTPNYRIYTTIVHDRILERLPRFLEVAMTQYTTALADLPRPRSSLVTYVFQDRRQWTAMTRKLLPDQAENFRKLGRGGYTTQGTSVLYYIDWAGRDRDTLAIAAHEGWHQYTQSVFRQALPIWLEEGIATWMEGYRYRRSEDMPDFQPGRNWERARALGDALRRREMIPLAELVDQTPQAFLEDGKDQLLTYYAQVWALSRFLAEGEEGRYRAALTEVLEDAAAGRIAQRIARSPAILARDARREAVADRAGPWVIYAYFNNDFDAFERAYLAFARSIAR